MKKCLYCGCEIDEGNIIDFCKKCGISVFGEKMLKAIIKNMEQAREKGDLYQGIMEQDSKEELTDRKDSLL